MNFSEPIKVQNGQIKWSDCGYLLASSSGPRLTIWDAANSEVVQVFTTKERIDYIEFSPDQTLILAANYKAAVVNLFSIDSSEWTGRISEGAAGLIKVEWTADSRHVVTTAEFNVKLTFWSLSNKTVSFIRNPKSCGRSIHYNKDKSIAAVVERQSNRDTINILSTDDWSLLRQFETDTEDLAGLVWCPNIDSLVVWDSPLNYLLQVFSLDGRLEFDYSAYQYQLAIRKVRFSPSGKLMAVASFDNEIRIFSCLEWTLVNQIDHFHSLHEGDPLSCRSVIYQEDELPLDDVDARLALELGGIIIQQSKYRTVNERPLFLDFTKTDPKKGGNLKVGVSSMEFSKCGRYLASKCDNLPTAVWIWDLYTLKLASIVLHKSSVRQFEWDSTQPRLAIVTGGAALYFWTPLGCVVGRIPPVSRGTVNGITDLSWNKRGKAILLFNRDAAVLCRLKKKENKYQDDLDLEPSRDTDNSTTSQL